MQSINNLKILMMVCILCLAVACGKKDKTTVGDELTEDTSVTSVVESREPEISAGNEAFLQGDFQQAIAYYETAMRQNRAVAYYNIGVSHYMMHDIRAAEQAFRQAVEEDPNFDEAVMNLVAVLAEQEKSVEAEQYISRLVNKKKTARVYVDMANLSIKNGSSAKARLYYEKALAIDRHEPFVLSNYANYLISIGELDEGERILHQLEEHDFAVMYNLAYIEWLRGNAIDAYRKAQNAAMMQDISEEGNNKLAALFAAMKQYYDEAETLRRLIIWNPKMEYRLRLVKSYIHARELEKAHDEADGLLADYPSEPDVIVQYYDVMIARDEITDAGRFIRAEYQKLRDDKLFYHTVRHISLYEYYTTDARDMINATQRNTPFINLARAAYNIREKNFTAAATALNRVPEQTYNDYYIYKSFLLFKNRDFVAAEELAYLIDDTKPEYFWYHFVLAWNLHKKDRLQALMDDYRADYITAARVPTFSYSLNPIEEDLDFTYSYENSGIDMAAQLLYPFFIEPDEMYPFLALGYRFLQEKDTAPAMIELQRSLEYSKAVSQNNEGIVKFMAYDYRGALAKFKEAEEVLDLDPFLNYNIGLATYMLGDLDEANKRFDRAISLNRYIAPAYIAKAALHNLAGNTDEAIRFLNLSMVNADEYLTTNTPMILPMVTQAKYLAMLGQGSTGRIVDFAAREANANNFVTALSDLARYLESEQAGNSDIEKLESFRDSNIYRSKELAYLLQLSYSQPESIQEQMSADENIIMTAKYIIAKRKGELTDQFMQPYMNSPRVLMEMANLGMMIHDQGATLRYLQQLSRVDIKYAPQYKASLYYFIWTKSFANAEASYSALVNMQVNSKDLRYYMMLYFLINYNQRRFDAQVEEYIVDYPRDYRGRLMNAVKTFQNGNSTLFLTQINDLMMNEADMFDKMPLEIDIERF